MATSAFRANGVQVTSLVTCPVPATTAGLWWDGNTTGPKWRKADGSDVTLGAGGGGGSTGNWTFSSNVADLTGAGALTIGAGVATSIVLNPGAGAVLPSSSNAKDLGAPTTYWRNVYVNGLFLAPGANGVANTSQGATNTTGLTLAPNVADGASSIGLVVNTITSLSSGKMLSVKNAGVENFTVSYDGSYTQVRGTTANVRFVGTNNTGVQDSVTGYLIYNNFAVYQWTDVAFLGYGDNRGLGTATTPWGSTFSMQYMTTAQSITATATNTITPSTGSFVKLKLQSATNVTAMTISAGTDGQEMVVQVIQPGAGSAATMVTTWTNVSFAGGTGSFTATLGKRDEYTFMYDGTTSKWYEIGRALNLAN